MSKRVLIIEDERRILDILRFNLQQEGYETLEAQDGKTGLARALEADADLILLDVMLPQMDGFAVCSALRAAGRHTPVLMITAREEEKDKILGLESGADDYITKPFSVRELMARVKANIRRMEHYPKQQEEVVRYGRLRLHKDGQLLQKDGQNIELTQREFDLLALLAAEPGRVFSRQELMEKVWNYENFVGDLRGVDVTVRRLREKLEDDPAEPSFLITRRGLGYYFDENG